MALSFVGLNAAATNTVSLPAFTAGDLAIVFAFRDGSNTAPSLPAGWTDITGSGTFTCAIHVGYRVLQGGDTTTGVWTNATEIEVMVLRGQHLSTPIGSFFVSGAQNDAIMEYAGFQLTGNVGDGWLVGMAGNKTATNCNSVAIPGWVQRGGSIGTLSAHTYDPSTSQIYGDFTVNAANDWRSIEIEVLEAATTVTGTAQISLAAASVPATRTSHSVTVRARKTNAGHTASIGIHLFEGTTQRTTNELTQSLTASLADYTLAITDADAATITSYANLELRIRGFSTTGDLATFEVAEVALNIPTASSFTAPTAPQSLQATASNAQVALAWSAPASNGGSVVTSYKIYRSLTAGTETLLASPSGTGTTYVDTAPSVANGTTYFYKVSAVNAVGESVLSSEVSATPSAGTVPSAPQSLQATGGASQVSLTWAAPSQTIYPADSLVPSDTGSSSVTSYKIYRGLTSGSETLLVNPAGTGTSYVDTSAVGGTTYFYKVSAVNAAGEGALSNESSATPSTATTVPSAPLGLSAFGGNGAAVLNWSAPASNGGSAITAYKIYRSLSSGTETLLASPAGTGTTYTDFTVSNGTTYFYKVSAVNAIGESALSAEASALPTTPTAAGGVRTFQRFYGPAQIGNAASTLYTCPSSAQAVIRHIHVSNPTGAPVNFTLSIGASAAATRLWDATPIPANDFIDHYQDHNLSGGEIIQGFASSASTLNVTIDGYQLSLGTQFGTLDTATANINALKAAGVTEAEVEVGWDLYEPTDGAYSASYASQKLAQVQAFRNAGMKVTLGLALHYTPSWIFSGYANSKFKNQFGVEVNILNMVFNNTMRTKVASLIADIDTRIGLNNFSAIRLTSGGDAECLYPDQAADPGHGNEYWAYDVNAQGGANRPSTIPVCPYPGWKPGDLTYNAVAFTPAQVQTWYFWYLDALIDTVMFLAQTYRNRGYIGQFHVLTPGQGVAPDRFTGGINTHLDGTEDWCFCMGRGGAWNQFYGRIPNRTNLVAYCSSVADGSGNPVNNFPQPGDDAVALSDPQVDLWSSVRWIRYLAHLYGMPYAGENPGGGGGYGLAMMNTAVAMARACSMTDFFWARDSNLTDGVSGVTIANYGTAIAS